LGGEKEGGKGGGMDGKRDLKRGKIRSADPGDRQILGLSAEPDWV